MLLLLMFMVLLLLYWLFLLEFMPNEELPSEWDDVGILLRDPARPILKIGIFN